MMKNSIENIIKENKIMVIDGSMSTPLENRGVSLNSKLWTAKILAEQPELIKQVHKNYFKAGASSLRRKYSSWRSFMNGSSSAGR